MSIEEWRQKKIRQRGRFTVLQRLDYPVKLRRQRNRAWEFYEEMLSRDRSAHVSVGGLDSITLYIWLMSIGLKIPGISVSVLENKSIQKVHRALGLEIVKPYKSNVQVLNEVGFPVISKKIAGRINTLQNPTENNKTVRHAIITGECGKQGHFAQNSRMQLPQKWLKLFGGYENENEGVCYGKPDPDIKISNECCYWLKEKPCDDWAKIHDSAPFLGMMASEGGQREEALIEHGCNYYGKTVTRSAPFAIFQRQDILQLALDMDVWYHDHIELFEELYHAQPYGRNPDGSPKECGVYRYRMSEVLLEKDWYECSTEERDEALKKVDELSIIHQMLITLHYAIKADCNEVYDYMCRYKKGNGQIRLEAYRIFELYGWYFEPGEKEILDGTSELYEGEADE